MHKEGYIKCERLMPVEGFCFLDQVNALILRWQCFFVDKGAVHSRR